MLSFADSTDLLGDQPGLRDRFDRDGYVLLRRVIDTDLLLDVRARITCICQAKGWLKPDSDPMDALTVVAPCVEGDERYFDVYDDVQKLEAFHAVPHDPTVAACMVALLGDSAFPHPLSIARLMFPGEDEWATPPHQDYPNNQGTQSLYTCWMPLGDCPVELGSLCILRGSHRVGVAPLEFSLGAGNRRVKLDERFEGLDWVGGNLQLGDALVFHSLTVHESLPNTTDRMRLSVDYRFQREGDTLTEGCLHPHFRSRLSWEEIYVDWKREDLKYYWRQKRYAVQPWDPTYHELPAEQAKGAVQPSTSDRHELLRILTEEIRQRPGEVRIVEERIRERARRRRGR